MKKFKTTDLKKKKLVLLFPNSPFKNKFLSHVETFQSENWHE